MTNHTVDLEAVIVPPDTMGDIKDGEYAVVIADCQYKGWLLFKPQYVPRLLVALHNGDTFSWSVNSAAPKTLVRILKPGEKFTITVQSR